MSSSGQSSPAQESSGGGGAPAASSNKKLWRAVRAAYVVVVKKHRPKLAALGVHLHHLLSSSGRERHWARERSAAAAPALSCRSMDPAGAVVHPYPRGHGGRRASSRPAGASGLSCRSMDPAAAVRQYQYRPREVEFSCKSTPMHRRRRREQRRRRLQADQGPPSEPERYYGSSAAVTRLFELMDVEEAAEEAAGVDDDDGWELEAAVAWPALAVGPAPRQVRITDSPYLAREEESEDLRSAVDRRADEFIVWFHEQLRTQQPRSTHYRVR